jgi:ArsR family transcriptional regulator
MIEHLAQGARSVEALAAKLGQPVANISQHLQALRRGGIVSAERDGKFVHYSLADASVLSAFAVIRGVAERQLAEVDRIVRGYFDARDDMRPVGREELQALMRDGLVTLIDVRPADEFALGHVPGAINVPLREINAWSGSADAGKQIVAYCRGPWCVMSFEAVAALRSLGLAARRLEDGMPEWRAAGLPVEAAA